MNYMKKKTNYYMNDNTYTNNIVKLMLEHDLLIEDQIDEYREYLKTIREA